MNFCYNCAKLYDKKSGPCPFCGAAVSKRRAPICSCGVAPGEYLKNGRYRLGTASLHHGCLIYPAMDMEQNEPVGVKEFFSETICSRGSDGRTVVVPQDEKHADMFKNGLDGFLKKAERYSQFNECSGVIKCLDIFSENDTAYAVYERAEGSTLKSIIKQKGVFGFDEAMAVIHPLLSGLEELHNRHVYLWDFCPDDILVTLKGEIRLLSFDPGMQDAKRALGPNGLSVVLYPGYAPVELYSRRMENKGAWTDVYVVAVIMYKMLTGVSVPDANDRLGGKPLAAPSELGVIMPKHAETALIRALSLNWKYRQKYADEFLYGLMTQ